MRARDPRPAISKSGRNERRKAVATTLNAISVALLVTAVLQPLSARHFDLGVILLSATAFLVSQGVLHYVLGRVGD